MDDDPIPFQLASWNISIPVSDRGKECFTFQAIVIETSTKHAANPCRHFYELENPSIAPRKYSYTSGYQFVPMLKSKEWPISKIYRLAKLHVNIIDGLRPLYLENLQDKHQMINKYGDSLLQGFLNATISALDTTPLFHSIIWVKGIINYS